MDMIQYRCIYIYEQLGVDGKFYVEGHDTLGQNIKMEHTTMPTRYDVRESPACISLLSEDTVLQSLCPWSERSISLPIGQGGEQVLSGVSGVLNNTDGLLFELDSVNVLESGWCPNDTVRCPNHLLQVLPVLCCAAGEPHRAAVGQEAFYHWLIEVGQQVVREMSVL